MMGTIVQGSDIALVLQYRMQTIDPTESES
jgi:hypothetical protein